MTLRQATLSLVAAVLLSLATSNAPYAAAPTAAAAPCEEGDTESRTDPSVDEGEIRWTESSKYDSERAHAITEWNKLRKISIAPDAVNTVNDLEFRDYSKPDTIGGYWERRGGIAQTDYIYLNKHNLDGMGPAFRRNVLVHELGHALGLCHKSGHYLSVMWNRKSDVDKPTAVDQANYTRLWG
ncbi:hypothetical protein [Streptomyces sp. NPDC094032]|uniref:hypothetical protein n=1 Tax=Streptomyces sp. NPDC094032 TaxID=3155308 RepID=UPI00331A5D85